MACLAIVQQEHGYVSRREREARRRVPRHAADRGARGHDLLQHVQPAAGRARSSSTSAPTCRASCATASTRSSTCAARLGIDEGGTTADGLFTVQKSECLGACADAPVLLVNDRQMVQLHERRRASTSWSPSLRDAGRGERRHERHARPVAASRPTAPRPASTTATSARRSTPASTARNWRLKDYEARGGYQALRKILGQGERRRA